MKIVTLYSSSRSSASDRSAPTANPHPATTADRSDDSSSVKVPSKKPRARWRDLCARYERPLWMAAAGLLSLLVVFTHRLITPAPRPVTQEDISAAVLHTLETNVLPSAAAKAYEIIRPSIVRVRRMEPNKNGEDNEKGVGTGVVIVDKGVILTNLHVVLGATRVQVVFADGLESEATVTGIQPEH